LYIKCYTKVLINLSTIIILTQFSQAFTTAGVPTLDQATSSSNNPSSPSSSASQLLTDQISKANTSAASQLMKAFGIQSAADKEKFLKSGFGDGGEDLDVDEDLDDEDLIQIVDSKEY
jgi:hypothetical protein